jgi:hypothetical protein
MPSATAPVPVSSTYATHAAAGHAVHAVRLWVEVGLARRSGGCVFCKCLLDTGAPLSVVPFAIHQSRDLAWQPVPGPWPTGFTTWFGVPCTVGAIEVWLPIPQSPYLLGPFTFLAKFAQAKSPSIPGNYPVVMGLNFLVDQRAEVALRCHPIPPAGSVSLP